MSSRVSDGLRVAVEQAFFGGDAQARAVDVDAAAFEHPVEVLRRQVRVRGQDRTDLPVAGHHELVAPPVEVEIACLAPRAGADDYGACVAQPDIAEGYDEQLHALIDERLGDIGIVMVADEKMHFFAAPAVMDGVGESGDITPRRLDLPRPFLGHMGKADPDGVVGRPLGGHAQCHRVKVLCLDADGIDRVIQNAAIQNGLCHSGLPELEAPRNRGGAVVVVTCRRATCRGRRGIRRPRPSSARRRSSPASALRHNRGAGPTSCRPSW